MHLYPQRRNVAAQVAEELKTVTFTTPPMEECGEKKEKKKTCDVTLWDNYVLLVGDEFRLLVTGVDPLGLDELQAGILCQRLQHQEDTLINRY